MPTSPVDHPVLAVLAFLSALPLGWPLIRTFLWSAEDDIDDAAREPVLSFLGWFPEWTFLKFFWLLVVFAALTVMFYKLYVFTGGLLGLVA